MGRPNRRTTPPASQNATTTPRVLVDELETPKLVEDMLGRLSGSSAEWRHAAERLYKMSYYFGGLVVATRETADGPEVVFSGPIKEVADGINRLPREQAEGLLISSPDPIDVHIAGLPLAGRAVS